MNKATARNIRVQNRYDELMGIGRHGHYETMFQVVREEVELGYAIAFEDGLKVEREECARVCEEIRVIVDGNHAWTGLHVQEQCINTIRARSTK